MLIVKTNLYKILGSKNIQGFWSLGLKGMKFLLGQNNSCEYLIQERSRPLAFAGLRGMAILRPGVCAKYDSGL